jgi:phage terminase large subunit-like protein
MQSTRSIVATHTQTLGLELSRRSRMILKSEQFRRLFNIELEDDQDAKGFWVTKGGGSRFSCTVSGANPIGFHSHFLIVDDPIDPEKVLSKVSLQTAKQFMEETLPSRKIDNLVSVTILIMQRLAQDDPSANMLKEPNVKHICLPAEDGDNVSPPEVRKYYQNGLLDPVRLPQEVLNVKKKRPYYYSGQYLERPIPKGGGLFQVNRAFLIAPDGTPIPHSNHPPLITIVRFWDTALSAGKGAYTVGWKMGDDGQNFWILHVAREQKEPGERNRWIRQIAERDGKDVEQCIEQPSGFGKESAEATARALAGFRVRLEPVKSNKETRWDTFADQWNVGGVNMMQGEWNQDVIDEYEHCPFSTYKDQLDAGSDCFARLIAIREEKERKRKEEEFLKGILLTNNVPEAYKRKMENLKQNREIAADNSVSKIDMGNGEIVEIPWDE